MGLLGLACIVVAGCSDPMSKGPYLSRRTAHNTKLHTKGPSPQAWEKEEPPANVREILYQSDDLQLKAWVYVPKTPPDTRHPALVYFHGGFAFGATDLSDCQPFIDAGFVVMTPTLRGENGNPGNFEMFWGEVDDGAAAVKWLHEQSYVDQDRIYTFGHSSGGVISALLSLMEDVPVQHGGSSGGLYGTDLFDYISDRVPFDLADPVERELRVLPGNVAWMKRKHYAFVGRNDEGVVLGVTLAKKEISQIESLLQIIMLPGDHFTSTRTAMQRYTDLILERR